jgi:hypothetical protein
MPKAFAHKAFARRAFAHRAFAHAASFAGRHVMLTAPRALGSV